MASDDNRELGTWFRARETAVRDIPDRSATSASVARFAIGTSLR